MRKLGLEVGAAVFAFEKGFVKTVGSSTLNQLITLPAVSTFLSGIVSDELEQNFFI
jgi:hypothetical protein